MDIKYVKEPTDLMCGQAVLSMLTDIPVEEVASLLSNERETTLKEMENFLLMHDKTLEKRKEIFSKEQLPKIAILSLETPRCWHWSLYYNGTFYDPEHGVMDDFPIAKRKYCFEVKEKTR